MSRGIGVHYAVQVLSVFDLSFDLALLDLTPDAVWYNAQTFGYFFACHPHDCLLPAYDLRQSLLITPRPKCKTRTLFRSGRQRNPA